MVDPRFDADHAVCRVGLGGAVVDLGAQCMARHLPIADGVDPAHFTAAQAPGNLNHDALGACAHGPTGRLFHRPLPADAALQLLGHVLCHQLRVGLRLINLAHVDLDLLVGQLLQIDPQHIDVRALAPDDNPGLGRVDDNVDLVGLALDLDETDACPRRVAVNHGADIAILAKLIHVVIPHSKPSALVLLDNAQAKAGRMYFASHGTPFVWPATRRPKARPAQR